jgi:electron transfer flavoprotein alpha subunit
MSNDIFVIVEHRDGAVLESTLELLGQARALAATTGGDAVAILCAADAGPLTGQLGGADRILAAEGPGFADFTPAGYLAAIAPVIRERDPLLVLVAASGAGMDIAAGLSGATARPLVVAAIGLAIDGKGPVVTSQLYAGKIQARSRFREGRGIVSVVVGTFPVDAGRSGGARAIEKLAAAGTDSRVRFKGLHRPEAGDVDITRESILVSVGRGIGDKDNLEIVEALAAALGGAVSSSRPIADAGWLPRTRQVGKSGLRVKPRLYLALGISGAPEHLEGMRGAELIIAINTDPRAPIFGVAHYGAVVDLLDVAPALTTRLGG